MSIQTRRLSRHMPSVSLPPTGQLTISNVSANTSGTSLTISWNTTIPADSHAALYFGPAKHCTWDYQLGATTINTTNNDQVYGFDAFDHTAADAAGKYTIAYFSAGSWEDWRSDAAAFPESVKGNNLDGWAGEKWLDIRQLSVLQPIMEARANLAKSKGFHAIEWDNVDGYLNTTGFTLAAADQIAYNKMLARITHARGMAAFLKNCTDLVPTLEPYFEGGIVEQAYQYNEAAVYMAFSSANKPLLAVEYSAPSAASQADAATRGYSLILQTLNLTGAYTASYVTNPAAAVTLTDTASPQSNTVATTLHSLTLTGLTSGQAYGYLVWSSVAGEIVYDQTPRSIVIS